MVDVGEELIVRLVCEPATDVIARVVGEAQPGNGLAQFDRRLRILSEEPCLRLERQTNSREVGGGEPTAQSINFLVKRRSDRSSR